MLLHIFIPYGLHVLLQQLEINSNNISSVLSFSWVLLPIDFLMYVFTFRVGTFAPNFTENSWFILSWRIESRIRNEKWVRNESKVKSDTRSSFQYSTQIIPKSIIRFDPMIQFDSNSKSVITSQLRSTSFSHHRPLIKSVSCTLSSADRADVDISRHGIARLIGRSAFNRLPSVREIERRIMFLQ